MKSQRKFVPSAYAESLYEYLGSEEAETRYSSREDRDLVNALRALNLDQFSKVINRLGFNEDNPFNIGTEVRSRILDTLANTVSKKVPNVNAGRRRNEIPNPLGR